MQDLSHENECDAQESEFVGGRHFHVETESKDNVEMPYCQEQELSELHASPHIYIWIKTFHIWIYMDKTIWECALDVGYREVLAESASFL